MPGFNQIVLMGKLVLDPELRYPAGLPVCRLRLVVPRWYKTKDGERKSDSLFIDVQVWRKMAEICSQALEKGSQIMVAGRLQLNEWVDKEGRKRSTYRVQSERIQFLSRKEESAEGGAEEAETEAEAA